MHCTESVRFLGLVLDRALSFHSYTEQVSKKMSSAIFALRSLRNIDDTNVLMVGNYGFKHPHLAYAVPIWGQESQKTLFIFKL